LEVERRQVAKQTEEEFFQHVQQVLTKPHEEQEVNVIKVENNVFPQIGPKAKVVWVT